MSRGGGSHQPLLSSHPTLVQYQTKLIPLLVRIPLLLPAGETQTKRAVVGGKTVTEARVDVTRSCCANG